MISKLKQDSLILGLIIGSLLPVISFFILNKLVFLINEFFNTGSFIENEKLMLLAVFFNLLPLRYYFVSLKYEKSGKGLLIITFILIITYFLIF